MPEIAPVSVWTRPRPEARRQRAGRRPVRGPRARVADAEGWPRCRCGASQATSAPARPSLYRYITDRDELLELMVDAAQGEARCRRPTREWRTDLGRVAHGLRASLLRHPWLAGELAGRPSLGPNSLRRPNPPCAPPSRSRPTSPWPRRRLAPCTAYVLGSVATQQAVAARRAAHRPDRGAVAAQRRPLHPARSSRRASTRCSPAASSKPRTLDPDVEFAFGLECVLDGLAARLRPGGDLPAG